MRRRLGIPDPVILETHGGRGEIFRRVYSDVSRGIVFDTELSSVEALATQRPTWAVYQARSDWALGEGAGSNLTVELLDVDPYGEPWPTIEAFFASDRPRAPRLGVVVCDGLRAKLLLNAGWHVRSMRDALDRYGNAHLHEHYLEIAKGKLEEYSARAGYRLTHWTGYYCGNREEITHYAAILERGRVRAKRAA